MRKIEQIHSREQSLQLQKKNRKIGSSKEFKTRIGEFLFGNPIIKAPREIDLVDGDRSQMELFFTMLRETLADNPKCIYLSFEYTTVFKAMPMLAIYSIIDDAREELGITTKINVMWSKRSGDVNTIIRISGRFLPASEREQLVERSDHLPVIMGDNSRAIELSEKLVDYILDKYFPEADAEKEQQISSAIQETIDNVGRHAYPDIEDHTQKRWWFDCNRIHDNLYIVIYDRGIGIPSSLSKNNAVFLARINALYNEKYVDAVGEEATLDDLTGLERLKTWFSNNLNDGQLIRAAMHIDVTSTDLAKHGQGSKSIKGLITNDENSYLLMFSNLGFYCYSKDREDTERSIRNYKHAIPGTLIQWSI
ncbi:hypothetical protein LNL84_18325 [Vibrio sp. ZSDZ34]|uniref:ATP-binding protein n=1 Tax=Vibrio gelatinilyticus TaxID=2893468 RepID=A0A9X1WFZ2_9VIBR|nr:hypothetical protein [Vibrio gelatinilyticus]MCJ2378770.1 hypothetical protein [Vibrio gelatinilyticus]